MGGTKELICFNRLVKRQLDVSKCACAKFGTGVSFAIQNMRQPAPHIKMTQYFYQLLFTNDL